MNHLSKTPQCNTFPILALAVKAQDSPDHLSWALANDFALEYSLDPTAFGLLPVHLGTAIQAGVPVRFHGRYFRQEIGHPDIRISESAMKIHLKTVDIGHIISCQRVQSGELSVTDFIDLFDDRLAEVHMYGYEVDRHYPVTDSRQFEPIITRLLQTSCRWWTIELDDRDEALSTRRLLQDCMSETVLSFSYPAAEFVLPDCRLLGQSAAQVFGIQQSEFRIGRM